ncbi:MULTISPECIES: hypothetical protein [Pandoraea]|uniref:hypothetical protein n=1 Tax=Pandoraea TaxID=93217 RepID=UPI001FEA197E|nr:MULTISPECIES: hypothetical protein [Pandoraea]
MNTEISELDCPPFIPAAFRRYRLQCMPDGCYALFKRNGDTAWRGGQRADLQGRLSGKTTLRQAIKRDGFTWPECEIGIGEMILNHTMEIERGIQLLALCQALKIEKDGVDRPAPQTIDQFARDINAASKNMSALYKLIPQMHRLAELGRRLEADGKLKVDYGDDYSTAALDFVMAEHGLR